MTRIAEYALYSATALVLCLSHSAAQQHPFARYGTADGLTQNYITAILQDNRGFLWVGTGDAGISRFDGRDFVTFDSHNASIPSAVTAMAFDGAQHLFVAGGNALRCLRLGADGLDTADQVMNAQLGNIQAPITEMYMRAPRELYIAGRDRAWVFNLRDSTLSETAVLPPPHAWLQPMLPDIGIRAMALDCEQRRWLATDRGLLLHEDSGMTLFDSGNGLMVDDVLSVYCDDEGNVWAGTTDGLFRHTLSRIVNYLPSKELPDDTRGVWSILTTRDNAVWIGGIGGGLTRLYGGDRRNFRMTQGLPSNNVSSLLELPNGDILVGTDAGAVIVSGNAVLPIDELRALPDQRIEVVHRGSDARLWFGTHHGLVAWNGRALDVYDTGRGLPSSRVTSITEDALGYLWVGTHRGAARISLRTGTVEATAALEGIRIVCIYIDSKGRQWFGTVGGGVLLRREARIASITRKDGLAGNTVYFISEDEYGSIYFGCNTGISVLPDNVIEQLFDDPYRFRLQRRVKPGARQPTVRPTPLFTLSTRSGLAGDEMNSGAVHRDVRGRLWFGAIGGASCYQPSPPPSPRRWSYPECGRPPQGPGRQRFILSELYIDNVLTAAKPLMKLASDHRVFSARLLAPAFRNPGELRFLYRLEGLEESWHESDDGRIFYTAIPPGTYKLLFRAALGEGHWTPDLQLLTLEIAPPFTRTVWFWMLVFLTAVVLGATLMYWKSRRQLEIERMRTRIASDLHDDIGASLGAISLLGDIERGRASGHDTGNLERISALARGSVRSMSDIVWSINPAHDSMQGLQARLRESAEEFSRASGIDIGIELADMPTDHAIGAEQRRAVLLIAKEAMYNAVRHSACSAIALRLERRRGGWRLSVKDDGRGFDTAVAYSGEGLRNMRARAVELGWTLEYLSSDSGSSVVLDFFL
jgi:ligand-binding sensor domain-containing protein/signal transduction histidine kinase